MSNLLNPKPRFGLNLEANTMFDYVSSRDVPITPKYQAIDGQWNLALVKDLILAGKTIETAKLNNITPPAPIPVAPPRAAPQPNAGKVPTPTGRPATPPRAAANQPAPPPQPVGKPVAPAAVPTRSLTAAHLRDLGLEPLQRAALGITDQQYKVSGLTAEQLARVKMTPARASLLKLTEAQAAAFLG